MSLASLLGTPCTIVRSDPAPGLGPFSEANDAYGNVLKEETQVSTTCSLQQARASEAGEAGEFSDTEWELFLPTGTAIDTGDAVIVEGKRYEVTGAPWDAKEGSASVWHVEAKVRRTAGEEE